MKPEDKSTPVALAAKVHPEVKKLVEDLGRFYDDSSPSHIISEAVREAADRAKGFREWQEKKGKSGASK